MELSYHWVRLKTYIRFRVWKKHISTGRPTVRAQSCSVQMRYLGTSADFEWPVYARSIYTLVDALVEVSMAASGPEELRRRSPRVRVCIPALLLWEERQQEHTLMVRVSRFG